MRLHEPVTIISTAFQKSSSNNTGDFTAGLLFGCGNGKSGAASEKDTSSSAQSGAIVSGEGSADSEETYFFEAPTSGTPYEVISANWEKTKEKLKTDAKSGKSAEEFLKMRNSVFGAWVNVQGYLSINYKDFDDTIVPEILEIADDLYGISGVR